MRAPLLCTKLVTLSVGLALLSAACEDLQPNEPAQGGEGPMTRDQEPPLGSSPPPITPEMGGGSLMGGGTSAGEAGPLAGGEAGSTAGGGAGHADGGAGSAEGGEGPAGALEGGEGPVVCGELTESAIEALKPVDIIWVIDSSPSMGEEIEQVQRNLNAFTSRVASSGLDLRVALIAAERDLATADRDYLGVCIPPPLSAQDLCPDVDSERYRHVRLNVHSADPLQRFVEGRPQLDDFLRPQALKHIVFVTDDDAGWGLDAAEFMELVDGDELLRGAYIHSVIDEVGYQPSCAFDDSCSCGDERGETYINLSMQTSGLVFPICEMDWTPLFERLEERVIEGTELPCGYAFPPNSQGRTFGPDQLNVYWLPLGGEESLLAQVTGPEACADEPGWYYDDPVNPSVINLCEASCGEVQGEVRLEFGCMTVKR